MIKLYNTLTRKKQIFRPVKDKKVGIYSCGPTVYWNQHIGNMYAYIQWDVLVRFLKCSGYKVKWIMNITDVGHLTSDEDTGKDKLEKGAEREGLTVWQIADKYIGQFKESMGHLNIQEPDIMPRATNHIKEQIALIKKIEKNGFVYRTKTGLVFDASKFKGYAKFSKLNLKKLKAGERVQVDPVKKLPWDFLLWVTNQPNHIMQWESPWGKGFPGWHIECTAMSTKYLGKFFDIHTGGKEHIPVHHTNEIAQGYGAFKKQTAKYWLHNEWLLIDGGKVSKSLGNTVTTQDIIQKGLDPLALRYLALTSHYRQGLNFSWESLQGAQSALNNLRQKQFRSSACGTEKYKKEFLSYLEDDLNTPKALAYIWKLAKGNKLSKELLLDFDKILGLNLVLYRTKDKKIPEEILKLVQEREEYRKESNFEEADRIRKEIEKKGFAIEDTPEGPKIK
ncbi:MAG: cysteine--tRNA ligase [bacterium]|nr:cysteine--tRNA ligase [bacterium]